MSLRNTEHTKPGEGGLKKVLETLGREERGKEGEGRRSQERGRKGRRRGREGGGKGEGERERERRETHDGLLRFYS